jgi:hypothetical protein
MTDLFEPGPGGAKQDIMAQVREGMRVVDAAGDELGKVEYVKIGDPEAATVAEDMPTDRGIVRDVIEAFRDQDEPKVPEPLRSRLMRQGFIKIDGKGWIDTDRYVAADGISRVAGDTVTLLVTKDQIPSDDI